MKETAPLPRIAASSYLNTAPLIWSFINGPRQGAVELMTDEAPARCARMLAAGEVDAALVPVVEYQRIDEVLLVPGVCVGSHSAVRSVVLASKFEELSSARRVALDDSSRTSVALVKIIFREFLGFEPEWKVMRPNLDAMLEENDAALIIGDPAMKIVYGTGSGPGSPSGQPAWGGGCDLVEDSTRAELHVFDLAALWHTHTNLGFVFAMWMTLENRAEKVRTIDFAAARDEGLAQLDEIVSAYEPRISVPRSELESYLTKNISFALDDELVAGLELFFLLAQKHKLIAERRDLKMLC